MALDISATSPRVQYTVGSSSTTTFAYGFPIFQEADLKVYVDSTLKTLTTHYSVTGEGTTSGGNVVFGSGLTNCTVTIFRDVEIARTTDFPTSGSFQVGSLNTELDTITAVQQELEDKINRSVRLDDEDSAVAMTLPLKADRIGKILGFNSSTGVPESFVYLTNENTVALDGLTAGTVLASKYVLVDSNKDIGTFRNITLSGELDAGSLDVSGDADIDGTLEADAITIGGITLAETIADTVGAMVSSNTETGITVSYEDGDNTLDFALGASQTTITSLLATDIKIGEDNETKIDFETADTINFYAGNEKQLILTDGALTPGSNAILDLGTDALEFKDAYFDGTVEADAITIGGVTLAETIADTVGAMVGSNTETGIAVTYEDSDNTLDFVIGAGSIVNSMLADDAVGADELASNAVVTASIVDDAVTGAKIADDAINSEHYTDGSIDTAHIADDQITQAKMADDAIGADQLASSAVVTASIVDDNVTQAKIADDAVGADQLASSAVVTASIVDNAVTLAKMAGLARGKLITGDSSGDPSALAIGTNGQYLKSDGSDLVWGSATISGLACDDLTVGDGAVTLSTSAGDITIDAQGNDTDIIFKGTDGSSDTTFLTLDGSDAGTATFNHDIKLSDNSKIFVGSGDDLEIYHDASHSYVVDNGTGGLYVRGSAFVNIGSTAGESYVSGVENGAVSLYYNDTTKLATSSDGISVTGSLTATTTDNSDTLVLISTDADANSAPNLDFYRNSSSPADGDGTGKITFRGRNDNSQDVDFATIDTWSTDVSDGSEDGEWILRTMTAGTSRNRIVVSPTETVFNQEGIDANFRVEGDNNANLFKVDAGNDRVGIGGDPSVGFHVSLSAGGDHIAVINNASSSSPYVLNLKTTAAATDDNTRTFIMCEDSSAVRAMIYADGDMKNHDGTFTSISSDERLKSNITDANSQWDDIKNIKFRNFKKKDDIAQYGADKAKTLIGVVAQEAESVTPKLVQNRDPLAEEIKLNSVFGTLYKDGDEIPENKQIGDVKEVKEQVKVFKDSILFWKSAKALQEAMTRIETLETSNADLIKRVKALEDA